TDTLNYDTSKEKNPKPHVIDRVHFKQDMEGFLDRRHTHLYLLTIETKKLDTLTRGDYDEKSPAWSPDGKQLAFVSNRTADPDRNENADIWIMDATPKANARQLTTWTGSDVSPAWSPDGKSIAYIRSASSNNYLMYDGSLLAVIPSSGGEPILLTASLDRPSYSAPVWSLNGASIAMVIGDDRKHYIIEVPAKGGAITKVLEGNRSFYTIEKNPAGGWLSMMSEPQLPSELYAIENNTLRRLTHHQDEFVNSVELSTVEGFTSKSKDGTIVSGLLNIPPNTTAKKLPLILYIHGGPVSQDDWGFDLSRHILAADGYAVAGVNYRGSDSRGVAFQKAIYGDWGNKEVIDLLGAVDHLVKQGIADPDKLGVGGWSYGGILTNYLIASDTRFKAAVSGAGSALQLSLFGVDQYILQFENELGMPWNNLDRYLKLSYPFLKANRIKTPTLYMVGEKDFNVPSVGSEQMYEALRVQGVPTKLIIYPGQFHGLTIPSYRKDRYTRYLQWYNTYLKK
ncbi:MAG TPA: S9 family peptidase, partial [Cyclobacteriaceae bacterium]|nr:S9 family peptidase [Cyclobacteriaceae bacterium]